MLLRVVSRKGKAPTDHTVSKFNPMRVESARRRPAPRLVRPRLQLQLLVDGCSRAGKTVSLRYCCVAHA